MFKKSMRYIIVLIFFISICTSVIPVYAWEVDKHAKVTNIVDGDTFDVNTGDRIRLADVNAPEPSQEGGPEAKQYLTSLILGKTVYLDIDDVYTYDYGGTGSRLVCVVFIRHSSTHRLNVNEKLVREEHAVYSTYENEFNPPWALYWIYASPPPPPNNPPTAVVNGPYSGEAGTSISFSSAGSSDSDGTIDEYYWTFGDGDSSTSENPTHTYSSAGNYTVTLRVTDDDGATDTATSPCNVTTPPPPDPEPTPPPPTPPPPTPPPGPPPSPPPGPIPTPSPSPSPPPEPESPRRGNLTINLHNDELKQPESNEIVNVTSISQPDGQGKIVGFTNSKGLVVFHDILVGDYTFQASTDDYEDLEFNITVYEYYERRETIRLEAVESPIPPPPEDERFPVMNFILVVVLPISLAIFLILKFTGTKGVTSAIEPIQRARSLASDVTWQPFSYDVGEPGEGIQVGAWLDESLGGQRRLSFKPTRPLKEADSDLIEWLEIHLSDFGAVTLSENGEIEVICIEGVQYERLLEQISWVYYTLQENARS